MRYGVPEFLPRGCALDDPKALREIDRAQSIIEAQNHAIRRSLRKYSCLVELDRRAVSALRDNALLAGSLPEKLEEACPSEADRPRLISAFLCLLDELWADHLLLVEEVREGIDLERFAGREPGLEYIHRIGRAFEVGLAGVEDRLAQACARLRDDPRALTLESMGLARPSSTWTYQLDDEAPTQFSLSLAGGGIAGALAAGPFLLLRSAIGFLQRLVSPRLYSTAAVHENPPMGTQGTRSGDRGTTVDLGIDERSRGRLRELQKRYRGLAEDPLGSLPLILISTPAPDLPRWEERLADPWVMLESRVAEYRPHLELEDDLVPSVRVEFGTAQVAAAFGCSVHVPENNLPCAGSHILGRAADVFTMSVPDTEAGWYERVWEWTALWRQVVPEWMPFDLPDIQSPFNSAHLIRGNDILTDFYDAPAAVERLLDLVTDFMVRIVARARAAAGMENAEWLTDWGSFWKGKARISNCSMHLISPAFYRNFVLPRDARFLRTIGGGRVHYCGSHHEVIADYYRLPMLTGLDFDWDMHGVALVDQAPPHVVVTCTHPLQPGSPVLEGLLAGRWPKKRNIIVNAAAPSRGEGKELLRRLRKAAGY